MRNLMTNFVKKSEIRNDWYLIDGNNAVVGRLATIIAKIIRGKHKTTFTPHMDDGDFVVVKNVENIKFTGKKFKDKKYYRQFMINLQYVLPCKHCRINLKNNCALLILSYYIIRVI